MHMHWDIDLLEMQLSEMDELIKATAGILLLVVASYKSGRLSIVKGARTDRQQLTDTENVRQLNWRLLENKIQFVILIRCVFLLSYIVLVAPAITISG